MSCRNPNVDDCMANDTQSYTETFSNENSNDSGYWSNYQETPKTHGKKRLPIRIFVQCMLQLSVSSKIECFFSSKMSGA